MPAPLSASRPVWPRYAFTGPVPIARPYIVEKRCSIFVRCCSCSTLVSSPYVDRSATDATDTPGKTIARGRLSPMLTPDTGFSPCGSRSRMARASQPSVPTVSGSQVCQMSIERKCERGELG